ncbi:MAG TPA: DMT family transporter [Pseudonocardiaceae bacterium]|jgi:drug/metabolite transporter (DMT)-like permease|nr:DMT family transporter [Pseudonocardiaceae bacterium]
MTSRGNWVRFIGLALLWGSSFLWMKLGLQALTPVQVALARITVGALVVLGVCVVTRVRLPRDRRLWLHILVPALFGNVIPFTLFALGEQTEPTGVAGVLNATTPIWVLSLALLLRLEKRPSGPRLTGLLLGLAGTLLIFAPWQSSGLLSWGALECLGAAMSYAVAYNYIGHHLTGRISPIALAAGQLSLSSVMAAVVSPLDWQTPRLALLPLLGVLILGTLGTGLAFMWNNRLITEEGPTTASSLTYLIPPVSVLLGLVTLHEPLNMRVLAGMVVVLIGVGLSRHKHKTTKEVAVTPAQEPTSGQEQPVEAS